MHLPLPVHKPLWTYIFMAINILVWGAMTLLGGSQNTMVLVLFGAKVNELIIAGQYWRLLTACFIHIGITHLAFNVYALYAFGRQVEGRFGRHRFVALYLISGLCGSVLSFVGNDALSAGASGAIFGLLGATITYYLRYRQEFGESGKKQLRSLLLVAGFNLFWGFSSPGIDNLGHIGGLLGGLALGWAYCPLYRVSISSATRLPMVLDQWRPRRAWLVSFTLLILLVALIYVGILIKG